jgi:hypothetical protein
MRSSTVVCRGKETADGVALGVAIARLPGLPKGLLLGNSCNPRHQVVNRTDIIAQRARKKIHLEVVWANHSREDQWTQPDPDVMRVTPSLPV